MVDSNGLVWIPDSGVYSCEDGRTMAAIGWSLAEVLEAITRLDTLEPSDPSGPVED